jgi:hypothetical protein
LTTFLDKLAANVGVDRAKLDQAIRDAANQTLDQAVTDGHLTEQRATRLRERINNFPNNLSTFEHGHGPHSGFGRGPWRERAGAPWGMVGRLGIDKVVNDVATKLNLTGDALRTELQNGRSLLEIAQAQGISEADLRTIVSDSVKTQLDAAVAAGTLTQAQADKIRERVDTFPLDRSFLDHGSWMR